MKLTIKPIAKIDLDTIRNISNECFGKDYITHHQLLKYLIRPHLAFSLFYQQQLIGFCLIDPANENSDEAYSNKLDKESMVIKTIAIEPSKQGQGFGNHLLKFCIRYLISIKCKSAYYPEWVENERQAFSIKLKVLGFSQFNIYKHYWETDSLTRNYVCKRCGNPPCQCTLSLLKLNL